MLPKAEVAYFAIADISGYTNFLAAVELDHAQDIIADFMDAVVKALRPPFRLAKFEGDAAFVYTTAETIDGSLLQDAIEGAYFKFRRRLRSVRQASTCECKACVAMGDLDFKFVVHHGEMVKQRMGGREELAGRDVILVHRLLKNTVGAKLGGRAYALYSDAAIRAMGVDPVAQGLIAHRETIDIIGDVTLWVRDLEAAWQQDDAQRRVEVTRADAHAMLEFDIAAPRQTVWEFLTVPGQWQQWWDADTIVEESGKGRRGVGTKNHCMHGTHTVVEELLDWHPADNFTVGITLPVPDAPRIVMTRAVLDGPDGTTHLELRLAKPKPKDRAFVDGALAKYAERMTQAIAGLRSMLEGKQPVSDAVEEPALTRSSGRFLTDPVKSGAPR
ncbi:DUF2652 domain-containing protein [Bradyrhizobium septentrionale]|uniref:DUF2652 domain-containing protein n=1 Tax=Bradyrhizobium septentrionale TaxID=1404411 RepID=A0A973W3E4_9BRAD|nr:DUF2652 domain-containing protein [Bradyrhizobium septentrionale]UGY15586.1 DUF2652 domain-containing protein [Bradyrhizobium septentrionale]UGY24162.1 DUF2652 domain-containing protein [Bradyrhizobium septentrionale]